MRIVEIGDGGSSADSGDGDGGCSVGSGDHLYILTFFLVVLLQ